MKSRADAKLIPFFCQCQDCLEHFSLDGWVNSDHQILKLESHRRIEHDGNNIYHHRCGGNGHQRGRITLYPMLGF